MRIGFGKKLENALNEGATSGLRGKRGIKGLSGLPKTAVWDATSKCLLNCRFCFADRFGKSRDLETDGARQLISELAMRGVKTLVLTGGDPLCRRDLPVLLAYAGQLGLKTIVHTTGLAPKMDLEAILPFVSRVNLPLDGTKAVHAKVRGSEVHFDAVVECLKFLRSKGIAASVTTMVSAKNDGSLIGVARVLKEFSNIVLWRLLEFRPQQRGALHEAEFALPKGRFKKSQSEVEQFAKKEKWAVRLQFVPARVGEFDAGYFHVPSSGKFYFES